MYHRLGGMPSDGGMCTYQLSECDQLDRRTRRGTSNDSDNTSEALISTSALKHQSSDSETTSNRCDSEDEDLEENDESKGDDSDKNSVSGAGDPQSGTGDPHSGIGAAQSGTGDAQSGTGDHQSGTGDAQSGTGGNGYNGEEIRRTSGNSDVINNSVNDDGSVNDSVNDRCLSGRSFFNSVMRVITRVISCGSTNKGCSMVNSSISSSGSSNRSSGRTSTQPCLPTIRTTTPQPGLVINFTTDQSSNTGLEFETSSHHFDTDASERLLPRPAREAAARAAGGSGAGAGGAAGGAMSLPTHRRFLTLHRRKKRKPSSALAPHRVLVDDQYPGPTQNVLERVSHWDFNAFALDSVSGGRPVSILCVYLLHQYNLINTFKLDTVTVWKCFSLIEDGYHTTNPYHNAVHAADVTQAMHCYLQEPKILEHLTPLETLSALVAAVCHDLDHPGVNQPFLIATDNHLAALYKNLSVLENHHWRCAMGCLWESGLLHGWGEEQVCELQDQIRSLILATDITRQQEFLTKFKKYQESATLDMTAPNCRHFTLQIALKCADICNPCRPWDISKKWSQRICDEFYRQGDYERQLNIPVTALCDRYVTSVAKIQTGFIEYVVSPLFSAWHTWLGTSLSGAMMKNLNNNLVRWQDRLREDLPAPPVDGKREVPSLKEPQKADEADDESSSSSRTDGSGDNGPGPLPTSPHTLSVPAQQTVVGRRHSLPLNVPSMLPRTVIRRESLSSDGQHPIVLETVTMQGMELSSLSQPIDTPRAPADCVVPVATKMDDDAISMSCKKMATSLACSSTGLKSGKRRMSLPPLPTQTQKFRSPLQPLPATPSLEELRVPGVQHGGRQEEEEENDKEPKKSKSEGQGSASGGVGGSCGDDTQACDDMNCSSDDAPAPDESSISGEAHLSQLSVVPSLVADSSGKQQQPLYHPPEAPQSRPQVAPLPSHGDPSAVSHPRSGMVNSLSPRRASLDSNTSISCANINLNDNLNLLLLRNGGAALANKLLLSSSIKRGGDKENRVPLPKNRAVQLARTRQWRSLTHEEDDSNRNTVGHTGGKHLLPHQAVHLSTSHLRGRRGSAPLLERVQLASSRPVEAAGSPDHSPNFNSRRRASAPTHHLLHGLYESTRAGYHHNPLTTMDDDGHKQPSFNHTTTHGPMHHPADLPAEVALRLGLELESELSRSQQRASTQQGGRPQQCGRVPRGGGGGGGGGVIEQLYYRRGSGWGDPLTELLRYKQDCGVSQDSSSDMGDWYSSSPSGGAPTPSTPGGCAPLVLPPYSSHPYRRGSLPCDFSYSSELRLFHLETS